MEGLSELDVVGLDFKSQTAYLCEVATHIKGIQYGSNQQTVETIRKKHERQKAYAEKYLSNFPFRRYMLWSPVVPEGYITQQIGIIDGLEAVVNRAYTERIDELRQRAKQLSHDVGNPFFRTLQILEALKR
ncbi:hypothetical protein D3C86_1502820 [compost metagenome]